MSSFNISGWYYDLQLNNRLMSATLHPNRILSDDQSEWKPVDDPDEDFKEQGKNAYSKTAICKSIVTEDFNVSVANSWSDFGGDMLGQMWESIKPLAPYAGAFQEMISRAVADYNDPKNQEKVKKIQESTVSSTMADLMIYINDKFKNGEVKVEDYLNRALVVQGTRFSYYSGSGTSFGNLMMKFTLFPTYNEQGKFMSVDNQVENLFPYCIGKFVSGTDGIKKKEGEGTQEDKDKESAIDRMIGWQKPPGGFRANVENVDVVQEGTLLLRFGAYYAISNLVIENATFNFSKQMTKDPTNESERISPLYCDITIQLRPATKYSDKSLKSFVLSRKSSTIVKEINDKLKKNLEIPVSKNNYYLS